MLICAVERDGELHIPNGSFGFAEGDVVSFIAAPKNAQRFFKKINIETAAASDAMIVGGGKIAFYLAKQLLDASMSVFLKKIPRAAPSLPKNWTAPSSSAATARTSVFSRNPGSCRRTLSSR